ncbi:UNVERIFIED_CONTAM: Pro-Pol polyprotein [Sesamum radiatum]|uniref:Pro-Pol polyprotein n=1 Tax=Sesamum radiatum TaxID=300843 RepID=A0AAW2LL96_SESRA
MCVDFSDLNKVCPKDSYPLPRIDALIDSTSGCELMSFLDAFQGYNQIRLADEDQEKTSFVTDQGIFCYNIMPFGLKNAGATYQRLVNNMFREQISKNMEVYIDDMLVKSKRKEDHTRDLQACFGILQRFGMKLNPAKCTFGVHGGKFLGFMISQRGIDVNPEKINVILEMKPPRNIREVQRLTGHLAALNRFISRSSDKGLPFFKVLKKIENFQWTPQCQEAFEKLKGYLTSLPLLTKPVEGEHLYLYLATSQGAVSIVLTREEAREPNISGRMVKWAVELSEHGIEYRPRPAIKAQALADFMVELTDDEKETHQSWWKLFVDGLSTSQGSGAGVILETPQGERIQYALRFNFNASNNEAEYEALLAGMKLAQAAGAKYLEAYSDSQLVVNQHNKPCWKDKIEAYLTTGSLPLDKKEAKAIRVRAARFTMIAGDLYKRGFSQPYLKCLDPERAEYVLREVHKGSCGNHFEGRSLAGNVLRQGYFWPSMQRDALDIVRRCKKCQEHANIMHVLAAPMQPIPNPCPFDQWGMDLIGKLPRATGQREYLIVVVDYFSKWVEVKPLSKIFEKEIIKFVWKNIICRFGIPRAFVTDNGTQFQGKQFKRWCLELKIKQYFTSVGTPQSNGQTEVTNRTILQHLKARLDEAKGNWIDELPGVLWAYRTTARKSTGESPFNLVYGTEAVIPTEIGEEIL